jgi:hypothetical protein
VRRTATAARSSAPASSSAATTGRTGSAGGFAASPRAARCSCRTPWPLQVVHGRDLADWMLDLADVVSAEHSTRPDRRRRSRCTTYWKRPARSLERCGLRASARKLPAQARRRAVRPPAALARPPREPRVRRLLRGRREPGGRGWAPVSTARGERSRTPSPGSASEEPPRIRTTGRKRSRAASTLIANANCSRAGRRRAGLTSRDSTRGAAATSERAPRCRCSDLDARVGVTALRSYDQGVDWSPEGDAEYARRRGRHYGAPPRDALTQSAYTHLRRPPRTASTRAISPSPAANGTEAAAQARAQDGVHS